MPVGGWWREFGDLIDLTVPVDGAGVLLSAYFDASERDAGIFSVAGFAFGADRAKKAARRWHRLWGDTECHMTDLHARKKGSAFGDWTSEQAGERLRDSVKIINRYAAYGVAVSCDLREIKALLPIDANVDSEIYLDGFSSAYATCCHLAMFSLGRLVREHGSRSRIAYFFERGDKDQAKAARFWDLASGSALEEHYHHYSHTVIRKQDARLLEMSDILAWEWAKHRERVLEGRDMRPSLRAMLDPNSDGYGSPCDYASPSRRAVHLTGEPLVRYFTRIKEEILS